jgi:excinuclease UvrABC helicase subunit UvrB
VIRLNQEIMKQQSDQVKAKLLKEQNELFDILNQLRQDKYKRAVEEAERDVNDFVEQQHIKSRAKKQKLIHNELEDRMKELEQANKLLEDEREALDTV